MGHAISEGKGEAVDSEQFAVQPVVEKLSQVTQSRPIETQQVPMGASLGRLESGTAGRTGLDQPVARALLIERVQPTLAHQFADHKGEIGIPFQA